MKPENFQTRIDHLFGERAHLDSEIFSSWSQQRRQVILSPGERANSRKTTIQDGEKSLGTDTNNSVRGELEECCELATARSIPCRKDPGMGKDPPHF